MKQIKILFRPICWIKTIWRTSVRFFNIGIDGIIIDGCDYVEQENGDLICEICGEKT